MTPREPAAELAALLETLLPQALADADDAGSDADDWTGSEYAMRIAASLAPRLLAALAAVAKLAPEPTTDPLCRHRNVAGDDSRGQWACVRCGLAFDRAAAHHPDVPGLRERILAVIEQAHSDGLLFGGDPGLVDPSGWSKSTFPEVAGRIAAANLTEEPAPVDEAMLTTLEGILGECQEWTQYQHGDPSHIIDAIEQRVQAALRSPAAAPDTEDER